MPFPRILNLLNWIHIFPAFVSNGDFDTPLPHILLFLIPYYLKRDTRIWRPTLKMKLFFRVFIIADAVQFSMKDTLLPGTFCNRKGHVRKAWRRSKFITNFQHIFFWNPRNFQFISGQCISKSGSTGVADCYYDACKARPTQSSAVDRLRLQVALHRPRLQHSVWRGQARPRASRSPLFSPILFRSTFMLFS